MLRWIMVGCLSLVGGCTVCEEWGGCDDYLGISFHKPTKWDSGNYYVTVDADGEHGECTVWLPRANFPGSPCSDVFYWHGTRTSISYIGFYELPDEVTVVVRHEDRVLGQETFHPDYEEHLPPRVYCGAGCLWASLDMELE